jgi:hypothetical protein
VKLAAANTVSLPLASDHRVIARMAPQIGRNPMIIGGAALLARLCSSVADRLPPYPVPQPYSAEVEARGRIAA